MKWNWTHETVNKKPSTWVNAKRREFEEKLHVPMSVYSASGKMYFQPYLDARIVEAVDAPTLEAQLLNQIGKNGRKFSWLYDRGWYFDDLFAVTLTLVRKGLALQIVGRCGNFIGLKPTPSPVP